MLPPMLTNVRFALYAGFAVAILVALVAFGAYKYQKGYATAEAYYLGEINEALSIQAALERKIATSDLVAVTTTVTRRAALVQTIKYIKRPADPVECVTPEWLHAYNDGVRAAITAAGTAD